MKNVTTAEFIEKAKALNGNKYNYGEVQKSLTKNTTRSEFIIKATALLENKYIYDAVLN